MQPYVLLLAITFLGGLAGPAVWCVIIAAVCAIVFIALKAMGVAIPGWVVQVLWILVIAVVCIWAIKFLLTL